MSRDPCGAECHRGLCVQRQCPTRTVSRNETCNRSSRGMCRIRSRPPANGDGGPVAVLALRHVGRDDAAFVAGNHEKESGHRRGQHGSVCCRTAVVEDKFKVFEEASADLDRWRLRAQRVEQPEPGSDLAEDDAPFPLQPISQTVRTSLVSAGEHLRLVCDGLRCGNYYNASQYSTVRAAIVGSAQAVWVLAPDDPAIRRERGHTVMTETYIQLRKYHELVLRQGQQLQLSAEDEEWLREQIEWVKSREDAVRAVRSSRAELQGATFIESAAPVIFPGDEFRQAALRQSWSVLSSDAHVLIWSVALRTTFDSPPDKLSGLSIGTANGEALGDLAGWFSLAIHSLRRGWSLFDRRCEGR